MMAMCMLCCLMKCASSCFLVLMPSMLNWRMLCVRCVLGAAVCGWGRDGRGGEGGGDGWLEGGGDEGGDGVDEGGGVR